MNACPSLFLSCIALITATAHGSVIEDFSSYKSGDSFATGVSLGTPTGGWTGGWRTCSAYVETIGSIRADKPVDSGNYLDVKITGIPTPGNTSSGAISRSYAIPAKPFKLTFRFRPTTSDQLVRYFLFDNDVRAAGTAKTATWQIDSHAGVWRVIDGGNDNQPENYLDTSISITPGTPYTFTLQVDPAARVWSVTITDGKAAYTRKNLKFRTAHVTAERWLHFGAAELAVPATGVPIQYAVDSISIQP